MAAGKRNFRDNGNPGWGAGSAHHHDRSDGAEPFWKSYRNTGDSIAGRVTRIADADTDFKRMNIFDGMMADTPDALTLIAHDRNIDDDDKVLCCRLALQRKFHGDRLLAVLEILDPLITGPRGNLVAEAMPLALYLTALVRHEKEFLEVYEETSSGQFAARIVQEQPDLVESIAALQPQIDGLPPAPRVERNAPPAERPKVQKQVSPVLAAARAEIIVPKVAAALGGDDAECGATAAVTATRSDEAQKAVSENLTGSASEIETALDAALVENDVAAFEATAASLEGWTPARAADEPEASTLVLMAGGGDEAIASAAPTAQADAPAVNDRTFHQQNARSAFSRHATFRRKVSETPDDRQRLAQGDVDVKTIYHSIRALSKHGSTEDAERMLDLCAHNSKFVGSLYRKVLFYLANATFEPAKEMLGLFMQREAVASDPRARVLYAEILRVQGKPGEALDFLEQPGYVGVLRTSPANYAAYALSLRDLEGMGEAKAFLADALYTENSPVYGNTELARFANNFSSPRHGQSLLRNKLYRLSF